MKEKDDTVALIMRVPKKLGLDPDRHTLEWRVPLKGEECLVGKCCDPAHPQVVVVPKATYRIPTIHDYGKIVEVRDDIDDQWVSRILVAVSGDPKRYWICRHPGSTKRLAEWRFARIKVEVTGQTD